MLLASAVAASYVAAIHVWKPPPLARLPRNHPSVVRHRMWRVSVLCALLFAGLPPLLVWLGRYPDTRAVYRQFGVLPGLSGRPVAQDAAAVLAALAKIALLYMGPLCNYALSRPALGRDCRECFGTLLGFRDHVFAPVSEEFVYRAAVAAVLLPTTPAATVVWWSPLLFGFAHAHHGYQLYVHEHASAAAASAAVAFQLAYTYLFGVVAHRLYAAAHYNLWCPVVVHVVCNLNGFPTLDRGSVRHFWPYCGMLVAGAVLFVKVV